MTRKTPTKQASPSPARPGLRVDAITLLTLAGLVTALVVSVYSWQKMQLIEEIQENRLDRIERGIDSAAGARAEPAQPQRRRPDPDRVYEISTAGAPIRGSASAPITIVEFSDFQ